MYKYVYTNIPVCILYIYGYPCMYIMYIRISLYVYYVYTNIPVCILCIYEYPCMYMTVFVNVQ